ncbi:MAG: hypothetical protein C5B49_09210 [Bdellovibrio sp.]|nr:MAG: hypothetical protein C5B49_09210 [Bdellovibrio sp.]
MGDMFRFVVENIGHVFPILLSAAVAVVIILERSMALMVHYPMNNYEPFFDRLRGLIMRDRVQEAVALCEQYRSKPAARVARAGLMRAHQPEELIENGLQIAVSEATERIQARTAFLATIANVSTLFGLLGTIVGLVQSFNAVGSATAQQRSALLAQGISTAMNATMLGLGVAIPCMIAYAILINRSTKIVGQIEQAAIRVHDLMQQRYFTVENSDTQGGADEDAFPGPKLVRRRS